MSGDSLTFDAVLGVCQHKHRRIVLATLADGQRSLTFDDLTKAVLKYNHHTPVPEASEDVLTDIHLSLHHQHLPKLVSEGLVNYDSERQLVEATKQFEQVQPTLSTILGADPTLETSMKL